MCNAWNHPIGCTCGWGGDGHLGRSSGRIDSSTGVSIDNFIVYRDIYPDYFDSYTKPNAKCPVCGTSVYYYQSPHGGRVFFDELGPPWPKHECTDNSKKNILIIGTADKINIPPQWKLSGWIPVEISPMKLSIDSYSSYRVVPIGIPNAKSISIVVNHETSIILKFRDFVFVRRKSGRELSFSVFLISRTKEITFDLSVDSKQLTEFFMSSTPNK